MINTENKIWWQVKREELWMERHHCRWYYDDDDLIHHKFIHSFGWAGENTDVIHSILFYVFIHNSFWINCVILELLTHKKTRAQDVDVPALHSSFTAVREKGCRREEKRSMETKLWMNFDQMVELSIVDLTQVTSLLYCCICVWVKPEQMLEEQHFWMVKHTNNINISNKY